MLPLLDAPVRLTVAVRFYNTSKIPSFLKVAQKNKEIKKEGAKMKELTEKIIAIGLALALLCTPFVIGILLLPIVVLGTLLFCIVGKIK